jgi:SIKE family
VALVMENQSLLHENKQLNSLMHEYEQTLETVMGKLRGHSVSHRFIHPENHSFNEFVT